MTVTELAFIELNPPHKYHDHPFPDRFHKIGTWQAEASTHPVRFFTDPINPAVICVVTGWREPEHHKEWIKAGGGAKFQETVGPYVTVKALHHLDINFQEIPEKAQTIVVREYKHVDEVPQEGHENGDADHRRADWVGQGIDFESPADTPVFFQLKAYLGAGGAYQLDGSDALVFERITIF